jgi:electron transfer flavoprotein alpha subunit
MACVLVHIEADGDQPTPASLAALGEGRRVASSSGATLYAGVVVPAAAGKAQQNELVDLLGDHGADKVVFISAAGAVRPVLWATVGPALAAACDQLRPALTVLPASSGSHDVGARLATRMGAAYVSEPTIEHGPRGEVVLSRSVYGGGWRRRTSLDDLDRAVVVTMPPGRKPAKGAGEAEVLFLELRTAGDARVKLLAQDPDDGASLSSARVVVAGGAGVSRETWPLLEQLASALGAELGGTRALCARGVAPANREIGIGARAIAPELYVVCGASGSPAHLGAVSPDAEIVAIDRDPDAPIFKVASYGIVGRVEDVLPKLIAAVRGGGSS